MADKYRSPSEPELKNAVEVSRLICVDIDQNNNKYWNGYVLANGDFYCEYGRVQDAKGDCRHDYYELGSVSVATDHLHKKISEKKRKGYVEQKIVGGVSGFSGSASTRVDSGGLRKIATDQIQGDPEVKKLVAWLAEVNIHQITSNTQIKYNVSTGSFSTPLGTLITDEAISEARVKLNDIADYVVKRDWENTSYKRLIGEYLCLVPQDVGRVRGWHTTLLAGHDALQKQNDLLDALAASLQQSLSMPIVAGKPATTQKKVFDVSLAVVRDGLVLKHIDDLFYKTRNRVHASYDCKVKQAWTVLMPSCKAAFDPVATKLGNVMELFHGSSAQNLLSILKSSLRTRPPTSAYVSGKMFGSTGIYFSDQSTKSLNYAIGYWGGATSSRIFMFVADVSMGKMFIPRGPDSNLPKPGYDSTFAKAHVSSVSNNEMIVYRENQVNLKYLVEFSK